MAQNKQTINRTRLKNTEDNTKCTEIIFLINSSIGPFLLVKKALFSVWSVFVETMMAKCICVYSAILNKETCHSFEHKLVLNFYLAEVNLAVCIQF